MAPVKPPDRRDRPTGFRIRRPADRRSSSRSATRAIDVLELMGVLRRPLRAVEIVQALGFHPSTTNQLLKTLVDSAHLLFDARTMTYQPSPRLAGFSGWIVDLYGADERLLALTRELSAWTGRTVTISTANDLFMQIIDLSSPVARAAGRGQRLSLFGSTIGGAYLSMLDPAEVARLADRARIPKSAVAAVQADAAAIRRAGYAHGPSLLEGQDAAGAHWSLAMPLPAATWPVKLVLGMGEAPSEAGPALDGLVGQMREAVARSSDR